MKKETKNILKIKNKHTPRILNVILHPGKVISKYEGDEHFISAQQLIKLYGVLPTDRIIYSHGFYERGIAEGSEEWIHLFPRFCGDYWDIHKNDNEWYNKNI